MTDAWLKSAADRINRLLDEKQGIGADIADVFLEAKSKGYVPKVLRKAITRQRMEPAKRQEEDSILELYEAALDGPTREAVKLAASRGHLARDRRGDRLDHSTVARSVALKKKWCDRSKDDCGRRAVRQRHRQIRSQRNQHAD